MILRLIAPALCALSLLAAPAFAQQSKYSPELLAPFKPVNNLLSDSTVRVLSNDSDAAYGTVVSPDGYILTKASELRGPVTVVLKDGSAHEVEVVSVHKGTDLALLKLDLKKAGVPQLKPVKFSDSKQAATGNWLLAPSPRSDPVAVGIVSVPTRDLRGSELTSTVNYNRGVIGIGTVDCDEPQGAKITRFQKESAGQESGLMKDDIILSVDGRTVKDTPTLLEVLSDYRKEETIRIKVQRGDVCKEIDVTLGSRILDKDLDRGEIMNRYGSRLSGRRTGFPTILQTDMILDAHNCGGPVCDLDGNVLGISIARAGRVETWVLPSEVIRPLLTDMKAGKFPPPTSVKKVAVKADDN